MKYLKDNKTVIKILLLLVILGFVVPSINYFISYQSVEEELKTVSLPLSLDNIYTEIQKDIVQPYLVSSMMANDTFVQDWLKNDEKNNKQIEKYLSKIKNQYNMFSTFLVSQKTKNYYSHNGFIEKMSIKKTRNSWYYSFKESQKTHEINIDSNENLSNSMMMFINYKILDNNYKLIGVTGIALKIEHINNMLKTFRQKYGFKVTFFNTLGAVVLSEKRHNDYKSIDKNAELKPFKEKIISKTNNIFEITKNNTKYIISTKYIPELNLYLTIEAKVDSYIQKLIKMFYYNLIVSFFTIFIIAMFLYCMIRNHQKKLESMAYYDSLTNIYNRHYFITKILDVIKNSRRKEEEFCILFLDIDNFKNVNDALGHNVGDEVLKIVANVLKDSIRETDTIARWGGEEFVIYLSSIDVVNARIIAEKLRLLIENNIQLQEFLSFSLTISLGLSKFESGDDIDSVISRADKAMYLSKNNGKNLVSVL